MTRRPQDLWLNIVRLAALSLLAAAMLSAPAIAADFHATNAAELNAAFSASSSNGEDDIIYLAEGIYGGNFSYAAESARSLLVTGEAEASAAEIILDGMDSGTVLRAEGASEAGSIHLEGMTIQNGSDCGLRLPYKGGNLDVILSNVVIQNNSTARMGGGIRIGDYVGTTTTLNVEIRDSIIRYNHADKRGGAIKATPFGGNSTISILIANCLIYKNTANWTGGGIDLSASEIGDDNVTRAVVINSTISGNTSGLTDMHEDYMGGGIKVRAYQGNGASVSLDLYNAIVYGNHFIGQGAGSDLHVDEIGIGTATVNAYASDIGDVGGDLTVYTPVDVIAGNPQFADPATGDYHLRVYSPCMDTGDNAAPDLPTADLEGNPRIAYGRVDMGAYEDPEAIVYAAPDGLCGGNSPCYADLGSAFDWNGSRFILKAAQGIYSENATVDEEKRIYLQGGWDDSFSALSGSALIDSLTLNAGTLTLDKGRIGIAE